MNGAVLAAVSGVGFGVFQSVNARAVRGSEDPFASTLVQITVAALVLIAAAAGSGRLDDALDAPAWAIGDFAVAGMLHFLGGWSLLNVSQQRVGAARSSPLLTTVPVFGVVITFVTVGQVPGPLALAAIALMCAGAYLVAMRGGMQRPQLRDALPGLGCAFLWALSPTFILRGLDGLDSPLFGLTIGLVISVAVYVPAYVAWRGAGRAWQAVSGSAATLKVVAGVLVGLCTWWRWAALEDAAVGPVLALSLLSVPVVLLLAPLLAGRHVEAVTAGLWSGAGLVVSGALILIVA